MRWCNQQHDWSRIIGLASELWAAKQSHCHCSGTICLYTVWIFNLSLSMNDIFIYLFVFVFFFTSATKRLKKLHLQDFQAPAGKHFHASLEPQGAAVAMRRLRRRQARTGSDWSSAGLDDILREKKKKKQRAALEVFQCSDRVWSLGSSKAPTEKQVVPVRFNALPSEFREKVPSVSPNRHFIKSCFLSPWGSDMWGLQFSSCLA